MDTPPPPPPLPASVKRALRGFSATQVQEARKTLVSLAQNCTDFRTRKEAAEYIDKAARAEEDQFFKGDEQALEQLAMLPIEQQATAALQLFAKQAITRADLDMILKTVAADQSAKIADLELARLHLERENKDLAHLLQTGKRIDASALSQEPVVQ
ncbi:hypothetical protein HFO99_30600 [Rhizobium leguminosarum]|uniref:hypothetical protein n=1 Tax=Rhizobium leguminosarum TaxID=384 RepID=UPI001C961837|nr:hypothetical protein [Rhizobium leguminosarum]MBY5338207.1 hypothetical protein [Rhizobium leguminosarum]